MGVDCNTTHKNDAGHRHNSRSDGQQPTATGTGNPDPRWPRPKTLTACLTADLRGQRRFCRSTLIRWFLWTTRICRLSTSYFPILPYFAARRWGTGASQRWPSLALLPRRHPRGTGRWPNIACRCPPQASLDRTPSRVSPAFKLIFQAERAEMRRRSLFDQFFRIGFQLHWEMLDWIGEELRSPPTR